MLQIATNKSITLGYKFPSQKLSTSSSTSSQISTKNHQHQQNKAHDVTLIAGIYRPSIRARTDVYKENKGQYESDSDDGSNVYDEYNAFQTHNNYTSDEEDDNDEDGFV